MILKMMKIVTIINDNDITQSFHNHIERVGIERLGHIHSVPPQAIKSLGILNKSEILVYVSEKYGKNILIKTTLKVVKDWIYLN